MIRIELVPCYTDNYAYLLSRDGTAEAVIVDACEKGPVAAALRGRRLGAILSTHHHVDHVGGNEPLVAEHPGLSVYGHAREKHDGRIPSQTIGLSDGEVFSLLDTRVVALHVPGHTLTAVAYYFVDEELLFTGDTLFGAGCGRLFEGSPEMMMASLSRLAALPPETRVYSGHEYLARNIGFARLVDPDSDAVREREQDCLRRRAAGVPCEPSSVALELATNPFLRVDVDAVRASVSAREPVLQDELSSVEVLARLRRWRNTY